MNKTFGTLVKWMRVLVAAFLLLNAVGLKPAVVVQASSVTSATLTGGTGTVVVGNTLYAKSGGALTLTVATSSDTRCVKVTGDPTGEKQGAVGSGNGNGKSSWTFDYAAGSGNGLVTLTVTPHDKKDCTDSGQTVPVPGTVTYVLDNTPPVLTYSIDPVTNADGWSKGNSKGEVTVSWSAVDNPGGSGVMTVSGSTTVSAETSGQQITGEARDRLGNTTSGIATVKLDKSAPTITASQPPANDFGWYMADVPVSFTCTDNGPSGIKSCSLPVKVQSEGANQSVQGTAVDNADNASSVTVSGINIDKTAPTLTGKATSDPNANGWYNGDVTIQWTAEDALSGVNPATFTQHSVITGEGSALTVSNTVSDKAGMMTQSTSPAVNIDRTAPNTTVVAPPAWNNTSVSVNFNSLDAVSGVEATYYKLDSVDPQSGSSVTVDTEGIHDLEFWSVDKAGNEETHKIIQVKIDKTSPTISHTQSPSANGAGWNNSDVTITFTCGDTLSGIASCTDPTLASSEGTAQTITGTALDLAGNTANDPAMVSIDKTLPVISGSASPAANAKGWNNTAVTVTFTFTDDRSGVTSFTLPQTLGEGAGQSVIGTVVDAAGNSQQATVANINIDITPATLTGKVASEPNDAGWYNHDVSVAWTCEDTLSGLDRNCPANSLITGEGASLNASQTIHDIAGNETFTTVSGINIDRTAPSTDVKAPYGWSTTPIALDLAASDGLSGVEASYYILDGVPQSGTHISISSDGVHTLSYWSVDAAGNTEAAKTLTVMVDQTAPSISHSISPEPNQNGWVNSIPTVTFACTDETSGIAVCTEPQTVSAEGANLPVPGTAVDEAGNSTTDPAVVSVDMTPPVITAAPDRLANGYNWYNKNVVVAFTCTDQTGLSGIETCPPAQELGEGANQSASGTAYDAAGNAALTQLTGINIDETVPEISGAPTALANADGWYNGDVTITWTCYDQLSGIEGACPANSLITGEGKTLSASASISDKAGNSSEGRVDEIKIDRVKPVTTATAPENWTNADAVVTLTANDGLSGVKVTNYILDDGQTQSGTEISIATEGVHTIRYWSVDLAGNVEDQNSVVVKIDKTAPSITHSLLPLPNTAGWNNSAVTVTFVCGDALSGIASCTGPQSVAEDVQGKQVPGLAVDNAGNSTPDQATVNLDATKPSITASRSPEANVNGWSNADVTVSYTCTDNLSGIATCSANEKFADDGAGISATGTAVDAADNSSSVTVNNINVDKTAPSISGEATSEPNAVGWYKTPVSIHWTCNDATSGIDGYCPADTTLSGEGKDLSATESVSDKAGNSSSSTVSGINIDTTAPLTKHNAPAGWVNTAVTVNLTASDNGSGVAATFYSLDGGAGQQGTNVAIDTDGAHKLTFWSVDAAGNVEAAQTIDVKVDRVVPTIMHQQVPAANESGWNNTDVEVSFSCADQDNLSGLASCTEPQTLQAEGAGQTVSGTALDNASNQTDDKVTVNIDKTAPTISAAVNQKPNANHWFNQAVTVSFTCGDTLSGIQTCPSPVTLNEGDDQNASGTAVDAAGNTNQADVSGLNIDTTAPELSGAPTTSPNGQGWYKGDVVIHWTASDALSGLDHTIILADSTITSEGEGLTVNASARDLAGNTTTATSPAVKIDRKAPTTSASAPTNWVNTDVIVNLNASDNLSGVTTTKYVLDGGSEATGTSVGISAEGTHTLQYWSVDNAGNEEAHNTITITIDKSAPSIAYALDPKPNGAGWSNQPVTVIFSCQDQESLSGVQSCTARQTVSAEGEAQSVTGTAVDNAGNSAEAKVTLNIDWTPPTIEAAVSPAANAAGWNNMDVTVSFTCGDALSGINSCSIPATLGEGAGQSVTGTTADLAGNQAKVTVGNINIDETLPSISGTAVETPNAAGWYKGDVTVHWSVSDILSGIDTPPVDNKIIGEGDNLSTSTKVSDRAGNTKQATLGGIKIDRTASTTTSDEKGGWSKTAVTVHFTASDVLSGVAATYYTLDGGTAQAASQVTISMDGIHTLEYWSVDKAGNIETAKTATVSVDRTAPSITGAVTSQPNANGWYNGAVTVHFTCSDATSGIAGACPADVTLSSDGVNQSVTVTVSDNAGNEQSVTVGGINIDKTKPAITISGIKTDAKFTLGAVPAASCTATDALSGLAAPCMITISGGQPNGVGLFTYRASVTDQAGNEIIETGTFRVIYRFDGFLQPVNDTAHEVSRQVTSIFKGGSTIPLKFVVKSANGTVVMANTAPVFAKPVQGSSTSGAVVESLYKEAPSQGGTFTLSDGQYQYNWSTKSPITAGYYYRVGVMLDDGQTYTVNIGLR